MDAAALTCPQCGAAAAADAIECSFCHARLATTACPSCFGMVFVGSKHCAHCGAAITAVQAQASALQCPRGCGTLKALTLGGVALNECEHCSGV
ncbi:MAG TPA: zinc ribbon domain-containing protein, partial [Gemmatimonadaceae bacterium]